MTSEDKDRLYLLLSIAEDETKSDDERDEARRRLMAEIQIHDESMTAAMLGMNARLARTMAGLLESMREFGETVDKVQRVMMADLTPIEAAEVRVRHAAGEPVIDVICEVVDRRPA